MKGPLQIWVVVICSFAMLNCKKADPFVDHAVYEPTLSERLDYQETVTDEGLGAQEEIDDPETSDPEDSEGENQEDPDQPVSQAFSDSYGKLLGEVVLVSGEVDFEALDGQSKELSRLVKAIEITKLPEEIDVEARNVYLVNVYNALALFDAWERSSLSPDAPFEPGDDFFSRSRHFVGAMEPTLCSLDRLRQTIQETWEGEEGEQVAFLLTAPFDGFPSLMQEPVTSSARLDQAHRQKVLFVNRAENLFVDPDDSALILSPYFRTVLLPRFAQEEAPLLKMAASLVEALVEEETQVEAREAIELGKVRFSDETPETML